MKNWKKGLSLACAGLMSVSVLAGCTPKGNSASVEPNVINVEALKASWGVNWIYDIAEKFETVYADKGYKVNVLKPSSDMRNNVAVQQLARGYDATKVDMYISGGMNSSIVGAEGEYGILAEELSHLWDTKPIGYDGKEESKTLRQKTVDRLPAMMQDIYGKTYTIPYVMMTGGMVVNTRKLALYGINTLPTTTNEMFDMWTKIYTGANGQGNSETTKMFPFTYMPGTANAYTIDWFQLAIAQYDEKLSDEYWGFQTANADGTFTWWEDGVTAAANDALLASYEVMAQAFDINAASYGTTTQTLDQAQAQIMKATEGAVFMCNGSWFLNDMALSYASSLGDITFINFPVVSKLGIKLWGAKADAAKCEEMLRYAISQVDDLSKIDNAQAIATDMSSKFGVAVTKAEIEEVRSARYVYSDRTASGSHMVITKGSPKKDICELFIRMVASDDAAKTMADKANANSAFLTEKNTLSQHKFVQDASLIAIGGYATAHSNKAEGYRYALGRNQNSFFYSHIPAYIAGLQNATSIYDGNGGMSGKTVAETYHALAADMLAKESAALAEQLADWKTNNADRVEKYREIMNPAS